MWSDFYRNQAKLHCTVLYFSWLQTVYLIKLSGCSWLHKDQIKFSSVYSFSRLLSKNLKLETYTNLNLHVVCVWYLSLRGKNTDWRDVWKQKSERIFGPKREEVTWGWGKLHNEELHNLYSSCNSFFFFLKFNEMRRTEHVESMEENLKGRDDLKDEGIWY